MRKKQIKILSNDDLLKLLAWYLDHHFEKTFYHGNDKQQATWAIVELQSRLNNNRSLNANK